MIFSLAWLLDMVEAILISSIIPIDGQIRTCTGQDVVVEIRSRGLIIAFDLRLFIITCTLSIDVENDQDGQQDDCNTNETAA